MATTAVLLCAACGTSMWNQITDGVSAWEKVGFDTDFLVNVGIPGGSNATGVAGKATLAMKTTVPSKWITAAAVGGVVAAGKLSLDQKVDGLLGRALAGGDKANVTLRQLLSFTSGFTTDVTVGCMSDPDYDFVTCVKELYAVTPISAKPGTVFAFAECNYQFAGAVAAAVTGLSVGELFEQYAFAPLQMGMSSVVANPVLSTGLQSSPEDVSTFLSALLTGRLLPANVTSSLETVETDVVPATDLSLGPYCLGNYIDCYKWGTGVDRAQCLKLGTHADLLASSGSQMLLERNGGKSYYLQYTGMSTNSTGKAAQVFTEMARPLARRVARGVNPASVFRQDMLSEGAMTLLDLPDLVKQPPAPGQLRGDSKWQPLHDGLAAWAAADFDTDFGFSVGTATRSLYEATFGNFTMRTRLQGASLSKWPAASMIAAIVADRSNRLSFDDKPSKYLKWWATNSSDVRANITLRHLLSFTSGFQKDADVKCASDPSGDFIGCAKDLYDTLPAGAKPGTTFTYISCHLQFAGAMAAAATGLDIDVLFDRYLYQRAGMVDTTWGEKPYKNPSIAFGIMTTGADFENFLRGMLNYTVVPRAIAEEMEGDLTKGCDPAGDGWFGHYAMGHWYECIGYGTGSTAGGSADVKPFCKDAAIQAGPGLFGYYPLIDRKRGYYMQIVLQESFQKSGIPEYLRILTKPVVDVTIAGKDPRTSRAEILELGGGLLMRDFIYVQQSL